MAKKKNLENDDVAVIPEDMKDFTNELIKSLNKDCGDGDKVAYNLERDDAPTKVHRWIPTGCKQLDYIIANQNEGGLPEGRIIEIFGPPSIGKSHVAAQIAKNTQKLGGIAVYIDSENATSVENLKLLGVNIGERFIYADASCTEKVFELAENIILKTRSLKKDIPVTIIWDSVAATSPKAEILGDYDKDSIGLQARALSKGFRKLTTVVGHNRVTMICLNQTRTNIGVMYGDNQVPSGGKAIPFHASVRIRLGAGRHIENKDGEAIGIHVNAKTIKNKVSAPFRTCSFQIHFGVGIKEHEEIFDFLREKGPARFDDVEIEVEGTGGWKTLSVTNVKTNEKIVTKKFTKSSFDEVMNDPQYKTYIDRLMEKHFIRSANDMSDISIDEDSLVEVQSIVDELMPTGTNPED